MEDRESHTAGQVFAPQDEAGVAAILSESFPGTRIGESSHYSTGRHVRIDLPSDVEFFFERISEEEYLVRGEGADSRSLGDAAAQIAICLGQHELRCRFETYDSADSLIHYSHHEWPLPDKHEANKPRHSNPYQPPSFDDFP